MKILKFEQHINEAKSTKDKKKERPGNYASLKKLERMFRSMDTGKKFHMNSGGSLIKAEFVAFDPISGRVIYKAPSKKNKKEIKKRRISLHRIIDAIKK